MSYEFWAIAGKYRQRNTGEIYTLEDSEVRVLVNGAWEEDYVLYRNEQYIRFAAPKEQFDQEFEYIGYR